MKLIILATLVPALFGILAQADSADWNLPLTTHYSGTAGIVPQP